MKAPGSTWSILWPDKSTLTALSARGILVRLGALQWEPCSVATMRARLVDRAFKWTGVSVSESTTDEQFLRDLSAAGMFALMEPFDAAPPVVYNREVGQDGPTVEGD